MSSAKALDLENLCRTCMSNRSKVGARGNTKPLKRWIYETPTGWNEGPTIMELLRSVQPEIQVHVRDNLPKVMCADCIEQLQVTHEFLQMCKDTDEKFRKMLLLMSAENEQWQTEPPLLVRVKEIEDYNNSPILKFEAVEEERDINSVQQTSDLQQFSTQNRSNEANSLREDHNVDWMESRNSYRPYLNATNQQEAASVLYSQDDFLERDADSAMKNLSNQIKCLKESVHFHNRTVLNVALEMKNMLQNTTVPLSASQKYHSLFPISDFERLKEVETEITDETRLPMICTLKEIIGNSGIKKELEHILDISIILACNVDGKQNKLRFLEYPNFIDALYRSVSVEGLTYNQFLKDLRQAFRLAKNRYHKKQSIKRVRYTGSSDDEQSEENENQM